MVRLFLPLLAGVLGFLYLEIPIPRFIQWVILLVFISVTILVRVFLIRKFRFKYVFGINVYSVLIFAGYVLAQNHYQLNHPLHFSHHNIGNNLMRVKLVSPLDEKANTYQFTGKVLNVVKGDSVIGVKGKLVLWFQKDSFASGLNYGDIVWINPVFQPAMKPSNPNTFDYSKHLSRQNIFHQAYLKSSDWFPAGENEGNLVITLAHTLRLKALYTLEKNNIAGKEFGVASALLLGYREFLDEDLQRDFTSAGAMHILCVSGLHVGVIFMALSFIFGFLNRFRYGAIFKTVIVVLLIWFYAAITGFAPSVLRASAMFSFVAIGQTFYRSTNIYNTLAASAFMLLLFDPFIVTRLGFQLSYVAVLGIVSLQPYMGDFFHSRNKVINGIWGIVTVSIAAQIATGPLSIYYFNQFPNYFLVTNIIVIPITSLIIKGGILLFMTSWLQPLSELVGSILSYLILIMHRSVSFIESLPGSTSVNVVISYGELIFMSVAILLFALFLNYKHRTLLFAILFSILGLSISYGNRVINQAMLSQMVVYQVNRVKAVDFISNGQVLQFASDTLMKNPRLLKFNILGHRLKCGVGGKVPIILSDTVYSNQQSNFHLSKPFLFFDGHSICFFDRTTAILPEAAFNGNLDHVIISDSPRNSMAEISTAYPADYYVFDSSNFRSYHLRWVQECDSLGLKCWSVALQGAYVFNFSLND